MSHFILDMRKFQHTSHLGRQLLTTSSKDSLRFCIMSEPMRRLILERGFCRRISAGKSSSSTAALEAFLKSSWMRSPLRSVKSSGLAAHPTAGLSATARLCRALRHELGQKLGKYLEASMEQLDKSTSLRPFNWEPRKFFAFLMANSKGRFQTWIAPVACSFKRFLDWDFTIGISAIQGHSRMPEQVSTVAQGEKLTLPRARELGHIFHAAENANYESIKSEGLLIRATRKGWQKHRVAIHLTYAGGTESPGPGTVIRYGANVFYAKLDIESFSNHGHDLFLTDNGVVLCYEDIAPMYLTFHYRPPHEQDPGGLKHEGEATCGRSRLFL